MGILGDAAPPFCKRKDFVGAAFDPTIGEALNRVPKEQLEVVFKGFQPEYESFGLFPEVGAKLDEQRKVGGFALPKGRADNCHTVWDKDKNCYPTKAEIDLGTLRPILEILRERAIRNVILVGLAYDADVNETAIHAMRAAKAKLWNGDPNSGVTVLGHLTRPSYDGKPGFPFTADVCDGRADGNFCTEGSGTIPLYRKVQNRLEKEGVTLQRQQQTGDCLRATTTLQPVKVSKG